MLLKGKLPITGEIARRIRDPRCSLSFPCMGNRAGLPLEYEPGAQGQGFKIGFKYTKIPFFHFREKWDSLSERKLSRDFRKACENIFVPGLAFHESRKQDTVASLAFYQSCNTNMERSMGSLKRTISWDFLPLIFFHQTSPLCPYFKS